MSVTMLDPRLGVDRVYQYGEYQRLAARYRRRKRGAWYQDFFRILTRRQRPAVRLWSYKLALAGGALVLAASISGFAMLSSTNLGLAYAKQEVENGLAGLEQAAGEAVESNVADQTAVLAGESVKPGKVVYPVQTNYVVLTGVTPVGGNHLIEQLYPLSRGVIQVEP